MPPRSPPRALERSLAFRSRFRGAVIARCRAFQQFAPEPFAAGDSVVGFRPGRRERQKVGGPVLATMGRTPRSTTRRINRLKSAVADLLQPAIFRPPTFWRSRERGAGAAPTPNAAISLTDFLHESPLVAPF